MSLRYRRKNLSYMVKVNEKKNSFGKKLKLQLAFSAFILLVAVGMSFFDFIPRQRIRESLYRTYTVKEWHSTFMPLARKIGKTTSKITAMYTALFENNGNRKPLSDTPGAKADKAIAPDNVNISEKATKNNDIQKTDETENEKWRMPHMGEISSPFGKRVHPISGKTVMHNGIDISASQGENVFAVHSGMVEKTGYDADNGNYVVLSHGGGITSVYIHLSEILVSPGDNIGSDAPIGKVGSTGISTGPHLHFEIKENGVSVDPGKYIK